MTTTLETRNATQNATPVPDPHGTKPTTSAPNVPPGPGPADTPRKLFVFDLDGTVLNSAKRISPGTLAALRAADATGTVVAPATGRCLSEIAPYRPQLGFLRYAILENGALIWNFAENRALAHTVFGPAITARVLNATAGRRVFLQTMSDGIAYVGQGDLDAIDIWDAQAYRELFLAWLTPVADIRALARSRAAGIEKFNIWHASPAEAEETLALLAGIDAEVFRPEPSLVEIAPRGLSKAVGLATLARLAGVAPGNTIAVGDSENDAAMLRAAGTGLAMANAAPAIRAQADGVVPSNDAEGVAYALRAHILSEARLA